ncbi:MAG: hypothetical protein HY652_11675 [Acidobacteria bacterium]|nr:hypothetical protein [Acidobacteriota bacterium]
MKSDGRSLSGLGEIGEIGELGEIVRRFRGRKILVFGDLLLDQFLTGQIARISREAPVLILRHQELVERPGGGANAVHNLCALGASVHPAGFLGADAAGDRLCSLLGAMRIPTGALIRVPHYWTPTKTRVQAGSFHSSQQQIVRIDRDRPFRSTPALRNRIQRHLARIAPKMDAIVISDYGYGTVDPASTLLLRRISRQQRIPLCVDSRFDLLKFSGVTALTPNISEVEEALNGPLRPFPRWVRHNHFRFGDDRALLEQVGRALLRRQRLDALLITRGRWGMTLFEKRRSPVHIAVSGTDEVADVTGAGDTVIATFTLSLASGATFEQAARLANHAGGIVVMKRGTATVSGPELLAVLQEGVENQGGNPSG